MTLTAQTKREQHTLADDEVSQVIESLLLILTARETDRLKGCIQQVEHTARELVSSIPRGPRTKRDPRAIAAAAVYAALRQVRGRSGVIIPIDRLEIAAGVSIGKLRNAWTKLFDRRVDLRRDRLELMHVDDTMGLSELIHGAIIHLQQGVEVTTPEIEGWFTRVEERALLLARDLNIPDGVHPEVAALSAIYDVSHRLDGPRVVSITFGDMMEVCGYGGGLVSRTKNMLFPDEG